MLTEGFGLTDSEVRFGQKKNFETVKHRDDLRARLGELETRLREVEKSLNEIERTGQDSFKREELRSQFDMIEGERREILEELTEISSHIDEEGWEKKEQSTTKGAQPESKPSRNFRVGDRVRMRSLSGEIDDWTIQSFTVGDPQMVRITKQSVGNDGHEETAMRNIQLKELDELNPFQDPLPDSPESVSKSEKSPKFSIGDTLEVDGRKYKVLYIDVSGNEPFYTLQSQDEQLDRIWKRESDFQHTSSSSPSEPKNGPVTNVAEPLPSEIPPAGPKGSEVKVRSPFKVGVVDVSRAVEEKARDIADERMTEERKNTRGFRNILKRVWKHNLFNAYYRNKEVVKARQEILSSGNLFAPEKADRSHHNAEMGAIVDRFVSDYDGMIHEGADEEKANLPETEEGRLVREQIVELIKRYANEEIDDQNFEEEKARMIMDIQRHYPDLLQGSEMFADNIGEIARSVKESIHEGVTLDELTDQIEVVLGRAKAGVRTEANFNRVDLVVEKLKKTKIGQFFNEATLASAVAIVGSVAQTATRSAASKTLAWITFGGSALVGAGFAAIRENQRQKEEWRQHHRERASGKEAGPDSPRRERYEQFRYNTETSSDLTCDLDEALAGLSGENPTQGDLDTTLARLAEIEGRIKLSDEQKIDLIAYSSTTSVEQERLQLDVARAEAKVMISQILAKNGSLSLHGSADLKSYLNLLSSARINELTEGDQGIRAKDCLFDKARRKEVAKAAIKGLATGLIVGTAFQEIRAGFTGELTPIGWLSAYFHGGLPRVDASAFHDHIITEGSNELTTIKVPSGIEAVNNPDGSVNFINAENGKVIGENLRFNPDGTFTDETKAALNEVGVRVSESTTEVADVVKTEEVLSTKEWAGIKMENEELNQIHRIRWYDNNTPRKYDFNELKLWWGGQSGVDADGNYVFNVSHMTPGGSVHKGFSANAGELVKDGRMKLLLSLSRDTQKFVYEVPVDMDGNAIIDKTSEAGKLLFEVNGEGHAVFKGQFAEVAYSDSIAKDGIENVKILATHVGHGIDEAPLVTEETLYRPVTEIAIDMPAEYDVLPPPIIPFGDRYPLEPMKQRQLPREHRSEYGSGTRPEGDLGRELVDFRKLYPDSESVLVAAEKLKESNPLIAEKLSELSVNPSPEVLQQLMNMIIDNSEVGKPAFGPEFYKSSEFINKLNNAETVVIILDDPIGDAILTAPVIDALMKYFEVAGTSKDIIIRSKHPDVFSPYLEKYGNITVESPEDNKEYDDRFLVFNGRKSPVAGSENYSTDSSRTKASSITEIRGNVIDFEWFSWLKQSYPTQVFAGDAKRNDTRVFRTLPGMIARNMELMTGTKLFDKLEKQEFRLPLPEDIDKQFGELKEKYSIEGEYIVISPSSSIKPKEYRPMDWRSVISGLISQKDWNKDVVIIRPQNEKDAERLERVVATLPQDKREKIKFVNESSLISIAALIKNAALSLTPDTGIGHLSSTVGTETLMLFSVANPTIWQSPGKNMHVMQSDHRVGQLIKDGAGTNPEAWNEENRGRYRTTAGSGLVNMSPGRVVRRVSHLLTKN